jgi:hypothetical protein
MGVGGNYRMSTPAARVLDTRSWAYGRLKPNFYVQMAPDYGAAADPHIRAFAVNITVVNPASSGYLSAWAGDTAPPTASAVNFSPHQTVPNMAIIPTSYCSNCGTATQSFVILNQSPGSIDLVVDVLGFFDDSTLGGLRFHAIAPTRIVDTRSHLGSVPLAPPAASETTTVVPPATVAVNDTFALVQNVTAVQPTAATFLTLWPAFTAAVRPQTSNVNAVAGQTVANGAITEVGDGNAFHITNGNGRVNVLVDTSGRFDLFPSYSFGTTTASIQATRRSAGAYGSAVAASRAAMSSDYVSAPQRAAGR